MNNIAHIIRTASGLVRTHGELARQQWRRDVVYAMHLKQISKTERSIAEAATEVLAKHIKEAVNGLLSLDKAADSLLSSLIDLDRWRREIIDGVFPPTAQAFGEGALSFMLVHGVDSSRAVRADGRKATTASEWIEQQTDIELPRGINTEWPSWLIDASVKELRESFSQDYWQSIAETTSGDINRVLEEGLQEGASIAEMARTIRDRFSPEYTLNRGRTIARTESANALNGGRDAAYKKLKEDAAEVNKFLHKEWLSVLSNTTRDSHANLDGAIADSDGMWELAGVRIPWPAHYTLPAEERVNCQCTITTVFGPEELVGASG